MINSGECNEIIDGGESAREFDLTGLPDKLYSITGIELNHEASSGVLCTRRSGKNSTRPILAVPPDQPDNQ